MFTLTLPLFSFFLILSTTTITTTGQPYKATDNILLNCGSSTSINDTNGRTWDGDEKSKFIASNILTTSFSSTPSIQDSSTNQQAYTSARIFNTSSFTYNFPVSEGPKFLRLYFYPTTYSNFNSDQSFFSVTSNGYSLLTNFSPSLTASFLSKPPLKVSSFFKEFIIYVNDTHMLNVTFTPSPNSFAFINGIEIVSMPENLYFKTNNLKYVGMNIGPGIDTYTGLENIYRLNVGGNQISSNADTGMYRSWDGDENYLFPPNVLGLTPVNYTPITYTADTPNYTAPELVYQTQRSMGNLSMSYNLTWRFPVDSGFYYMIRFHFCNIIPQYTSEGHMIFQIFINNQTAEKEADLFHWTPGSHYAVFKDYIVFVGDSNGERIKPDLSVAMHPNDGVSELYRDGFLNGLEMFKLSMNRNLSSSNPEPSSTTPPPDSTLAGKGKNKNKTPVIAGVVVGGGVVLLILALLVFRKRRQVKQYETPDDKSSWGQAYMESMSTKSIHSTLPSDRCRRFPLTELEAATNGFNDNCVIGIGGFGKVYKGDMDNLTTTVAIKRLNSASSQGSKEFDTEIRMLSKLRHVNLVPLIGYCDDEGEMLLVYEYMAHGTLREHLYKTNNPPLSWTTRLHICINAAKGLNYLHTGADYAIIHRDVKSTNILLDKNFVAKVSDFGLSKLGPTDHQQKHVSTVVKGSIGYVDPEYYRTNQLTDKSDVYSFGVVLLEVLCARPVMIASLPKEQMSLAYWGKLCYRKNATLEPIVDVKVKNEIAPECLRTFGDIAIKCLKDHKSERPTMEEVVCVLEFALELQELAAAKIVGEVVSDNQEFPFLMQSENTTTDDEVFTGSSAIRNGMSPISSSFEGYKSETVFSEMQKSTGR